MTNAPRLVYSITEACTALGISRSTIYSLVKAGALRTVKLGTRTVIPAAAIDHLLKGGDDA